MLNKINVLIIDDSAVVRDILESSLSKDPRINVVGTAMDPYIARTRIAQNKIDVITLDIEMPRMDGLTFLKYLMKSYPIPVIILSSLTRKNDEASFQALKLGAIDIVPKPGGPYSVGDVIEELTNKIIMASRIDFEKVKERTKSIQQTGSSLEAVKMLSKIKTTNKLIVVGASTGGTVALERLFINFPKNFPPTIAVIHMPERFTYTFAKRLNDICEVTVKEAVNNEKALKGHVYIAPGNHHLQVRMVGKDYLLKVIEGPKLHSQRPAVDVLFRSAAKYIGRNTYGVLLTGMGKDGAEGLLEIKEAGGHTVAQDESTSVVFGMPKAAIDIGGADIVLPLPKIYGHLLTRIQQD